MAVPNRTKTKSRGNLGDFVRVMSYITPYWQFKASMLLIVASTVLDVISPSILGSVIDLIEVFARGEEPGRAAGPAGVILLPISSWFSSVLGQKLNFTILGVYILTLIGIAGFIGLLNYVGRYITAWLSQKGSFEMRADLYNSLMEQSFSFYDKQRTGQLMARATGDIGMIERLYDFGFRMIISTLLLLVLAIYILFIMNIQLTLLSLSLFPVIFYTVWRFARRVSPLWQKIREQYGDITSIFQENLMGLRVIRGFAQEAQEEVKLAREADIYFNTNITVTRLRAFYMPLATLISSLGFVLIIWYGGFQVIQGALTLGGLVAFYFYVARLAQPVRMLGQISAMWLRATAASGRVFEIIDAEVSVHDKPNAMELSNPEGRVTFENVSFSYDEKNMVLKDINIDAKPGQTIAILGATGSGKSSVINLIPRFYDVNKGSIKIDGIDVRDIKIKSLREHVGIVRQDPFIFSMSFRDNIAYGVENSEMDGVEAAAKRAKIHDYITSIPTGYNTRVGERGVTVSGGQKQRIAIARALLKNPKILILDDSTSSVDTQTEHEIQEALDDLLENRTTFIITQRLSSIKKANYIVVLDNGVIAEEGTHEQLLAKDGVYKKLYETQISGGSKRESD